MRDVTLASLRSQIGIVTQETVLFNDTVRNNIAYGQPHVPQKEVEAAARAALAHDFILALPAGYDTVIGERGVRLSGGERQRLAIARALLKNAPDPDSGRGHVRARQRIRSSGAVRAANLMSGRTVFVIAHRLSTVRRADRIVVHRKWHDRRHRRARRVDAEVGHVPAALRIAIRGRGFDPKQSQKLENTAPMPIRSMTGFAQVRGEVQRPNARQRRPSPPARQSNGRLAFALSLKSVNHRFLDLHFRLPSGTDSLEMQLRRLLKEKMARGHVEVS